MMMRKSVTLLSTALVCVAGIFLISASGSETDTDKARVEIETRALAMGLPKFTKSGDLIRPVNYREWVYVGTPLTPNDMNNGKAPFPEFHNVYIEPSAWAHYQKTGLFPENTILVKELLSVGSKQAVSGAGYFMGDFIGLEATVKSKERFPNEPGNWAYYSFGHEYPLAETAKIFPSQACNACHANAAADDFVFTQYYPVLRAGKGPKTKGDGKTGKTTHDGEDCLKCKTAIKNFESVSNVDPKTPDDQGARESDLIPTDKDKLFKFLKAGKYKSFTLKEKAAHPSAGPHSIKGTFGQPVRSFFNQTMANSLKAKKKFHPQGAGVVKEMFSADGKTLEGWAVSLKTQKASDGGKGWYWYEVTSTNNPDALVANGNGVALCASCHSSSKRDFLLSTGPFK